MVSSSPNQPLVCSSSAPVSADLALDVQEGKEGLGRVGGGRRSSQTGEPMEEDPEGLGSSFCRVVLGVRGGQGDQLESRRQMEKARVESRNSSSSPGK